jgi:hypothetical protein
VLKRVDAAVLDGEIALNLSQGIVVVIWKQAGICFVSAFRWRLTRVNRIGSWSGTWIGTVCLVLILSGALLAASPDGDAFTPVDTQGQVQKSADGSSISRPPL